VPVHGTTSTFETVTVARASATMVKICSILALVILTPGSIRKLDRVVTSWAGVGLTCSAWSATPVVVIIVACLSTAFLVAIAGIQNPIRLASISSAAFAWRAALRWIRALAGLEQAHDVFGSRFVYQIVLRAIEFQATALLFTTSGLICISALFIRTH
jgi:hypothetical protein